MLILAFNLHRKYPHVQHQSSQPCQPSQANDEVKTSVQAALFSSPCPHFMCSRISSTLMQQFIVLILRLLWTSHPWWLFAPQNMNTRSPQALSVMTQRSHRHGRLRTLMSRGRKRIRVSSQKVRGSSDTLVCPCSSLSVFMLNFEFWNLKWWLFNNISCSRVL